MKDKNQKGKCSLNQSVKVAVPGDYAWKILGKLTQDLRHLLDESEYAEISTIIRNRDFEAYRSLSESWGPQSMSLAVPSLAKVRAKYQLTATLKKFQFPSDVNQRQATAVQKFKQAEINCANFNTIGAKVLALSKGDEDMCCVFTYARVFLEKLLGSTLPSRSDLTLWSRHGPGANLDTVRNHVSNYHKFENWPYSCTKDALGEAWLSIQDDERWLGALEDSYRSRNNIPKHSILDQDRFKASVLKVVPGNRITFVPKDALTERTIAIEPAMNLYLQLGVDGYIRRRLKRWGVDLDSQEKNKELARLGSLYWDSPDPFVTLDLAAASDTISTELCRLILPPQWYTYLMKLRSPEGELNNETISYEKISSMGNGYTFALESAIFTSVIYGVMRHYQGKFDRDRMAVFGDDLIVPSSIAIEVVKHLNQFGFTINSEKSFFEGPFRESCGADWYRGSAVRPVFLTSSPTTVMDIWTDLNRLRRILNLRFMIDDSEAEKLLGTWIPGRFRDIYGPNSDEEFSSYRHTSLPTGRKKRSLWEFRRVVVRPRQKAGPSFLFRKLMASLRSAPPILYNRPRALGCTISSSGSVFTVTSRNDVSVGFTNSVASDWQSEYQEVMPTI